MEKDKIFIPLDTDFNKISITEKEEIKKEGLLKAEVAEMPIFENLMQINIRQDDIFNNLLEEIEPIDFEYETYGNDINILRDQITEASDSKYKARFQKNYEKFSLIISKKFVIIIQFLLSIAHEKGYGMGISRGKFYFYNKRFWENRDYEFLYSFLGEFAQKAGLDRLDAKQFKNKELLLKQFESDAMLPTFNDKPKDNLIPLQNCVLLVENGEVELKSFKKEYYLKSLLPFKYDREAKAPIFINALNRILPDPILQNILFEFFGSVFIKNLKHEKMLFLHGNGSNGKSLIHNVINAVFGEENVTNHTLQSLCDADGQARASIENTLINFSSEIGNGKFDIDTFKQLISNEPVYGKFLYKDKFRVTNYGRFAFNGNTLPSFVENTDAFYRRFIIIPFNVHITDEEKDPYLSQKIISEELPGVFNLILEGMKRLLTQKGFSKSEIIDEEVKKYRRKSSSILSFLDDESYIKSTKTHMSSETFHVLYKDYCIKNGFHPFSTRAFNDQLRNMGFEIKRSTNGYYHINVEKSIPGIDDSSIVININRHINL
ncbi:DNA primase family protein [Flavobacterium sp. IMCC34518]|uniref:DNA primase family protein n=1 Tax=Flavobacterium sp. IMCC34518 TaxID=3003623 RepID=UPI002482B640|nr:DNA primase family protein [Flavobacterium sp. IMCC34518]